MPPSRHSRGAGGDLSRQSLSERRGRGKEGKVKLGSAATEAEWAPLRWQGGSGPAGCGRPVPYRHRSAMQSCAELAGPAFEHKSHRHWTRLGTANSAVTAGGKAPGRHVRSRQVCSLKAGCGPGSRWSALSSSLVPALPNVNLATAQRRTGRMQPLWARGRSKLPRSNLDHGLDMDAPD